MEIQLNKEEADFLNQIQEIIYGDSAHYPRRHCSGEVIKLTRIIELIIDASNEKRNREPILHCPEEEYHPPIKPMSLADLQAELCLQPESLRHNLYLWLKQLEKNAKVRANA